MKRHLLALVLFGFVPATHSQQAPPTNAGQQVAAQEPQQSDDTNPEAQTAAQAEPIPQQVPQAPSPNRGPYRKDWSHGHEVWPGTIQQPGTDESVCGDGRTYGRDRKVGLDGVAKSINPNDVNYGGLLALWRLQLVHDTILKADYWGVVVEGIAITFLLLYIFWMRNQRAERFRMTVDMVHQLLNSRAFARFHATRVIKIHNELVRKLNDEYESKLRSGGSDELDIAPQQLAIPRRTFEITGKEDAIEGDQIGPLSDVHPSANSYRGSAIPLVAAGEFSVDSELISPFVGRGTNSVEEVLAKANAAASAVDLPNTESVVGEDKDAVIRRLEAQVEAKDQRIRALRNNLNRHRQNEAGAANKGMDGAE
jgi:hypothetical protein